MPQTPDGFWNEKFFKFINKGRCISIKNLIPALLFECNTLKVTSLLILKGSDNDVQHSGLLGFLDFVHYPVF
jgi:hypothetical protein